MKTKTKIKFSPVLAIGVLLCAFAFNIFAAMNTFADSQKCAQWTINVTDSNGNQRQVQTDQFCATVGTDGNLINGKTVVNKSNSGYGIMKIHSSGYNSQRTSLWLDCRTGWHAISGHDCGGADGGEQNFTIKDGDTWTNWTTLIGEIEKALQALLGDYDGALHDNLTYVGDYFTNSVADTGDAGEIANRENLAGYDAAGKVNGWADRESCQNGELSLLINSALAMESAPASAKSTLKAVQHKTDDYAKRKVALEKYLNNIRTYFESRPRGMSDAMRDTIANLQGKLSVLETDTCPEDAAFYADATAETPDVSEADACYSNADAWGWVLCTILKGAGDAVEGLYTGFVEPELRVEPQLLATDSGTHDAWAVFRNFANILFIVFLVVVIFSQVTGFGIDNYGIKKVLPKLVVMAIMINLSYFLCQLAVDISNIAGVSLQGLFEWIGGNVGGSVNGGDFAAALSTVLVVLTGLGVGGGVAVHYLGWALVVPALLAILSGFLGILFLFFILGARKAAIILLIAIAPLAIACYALPNTKPWFDRWLKIFKAMLFVYPLCGLVLGAGHLSGTILLLVSDDFLTNVIALILYLGPVFAIPALLRSTISAADGALGKLMARGQGLTSNIKNSAGGAMRNSVRYQDYVKQRRGQRSLKYSNRVVDRLKRRSENGRPLNARQQRQLAYHSGAVEGARQEQVRGAMATFRNADGTYDDARADAVLTGLSAQENYSPDDLITMEAAAQRVATSNPERFSEIFDGANTSEEYRRKFTQVGMDNNTIRGAIGTADVAMMEQMKTISKQNAAKAAGRTIPAADDATKQTNAAYAAANWHDIIDSASHEAILAQKQNKLRNTLDNMSKDELTKLVENERAMRGAANKAREETLRIAASRNIHPTTWSPSGTPPTVEPPAENSGEAS